MPYIKVDTKKLATYGNVVSSTRGSVSKIQSSFYSIGNSLDWDVKACADINRRIRQINNELSNEIASLQRMETFFQMAVSKYNAAENEKDKLSKIPKITRLAPHRISMTKNNTNVALLSILKANNISSVKQVNISDVPDRLKYVLDKGWKNIVKTIAGKAEISDFYDLTLLVVHLIGNDDISIGAKNFRENPIIKNIAKIGFKSIKPLILAKYGYNITKKGGYYIVTGSRKLDKIKGITVLKPGRYKDIDPKYLKNFYSGAAVKELNSLKSLSSKLAAAEIFVETGKNVYDNIKNNESVTKITSDAVADLVIKTPKAFIKTATAAKTAVFTAKSIAVGATIGSAVPVVGTAIGAVVGGVIGIGASILADKAIDKVYDGIFEEWKICGGKSIKEWASEGVEWVINEAANGFKIAANTAIETARKVGNSVAVGTAKAKTAVVDFEKNIAETVETAKDVAVEKIVKAGNVVGNFAHEAENAVKTEFLNGVTNIKNVVTGKAIGYSW